MKTERYLIHLLFKCNIFKKRNVYTTSLNGFCIMTDLYLFLLQSEISELTASFKYTDKESGVDHIKLEIFEMFHGTRTQKYPGNCHHLSMSVE